MSEEEIAAAFMLDARVVKQRLKLAAVSPVLLDIYADDGMTLEQLMAFTVCDDHARQEQVWQGMRSSQRWPYDIRRALTETSVSVRNKRAIFVTLEGYVGAGGHVNRDLFSANDDGWLTDVALLDRLVDEKLAAAAAAIAAEGWKWVEHAVTLDYGFYGMRRLAGEPAPFTEAEISALAEAEAERDRLYEEYDGADEFPPEIADQLAALEEQLSAAENRPDIFAPDEIAIAGAFVSIDGDGFLRVDRGFVRPEDEPQSEDDAETTDVDLSPPALVTNPTGDQSDVAEDDEDDTKPLPERLVLELTAHRTLALRDAVAQDPHIAMTALLHRLVSDKFSYRHTGALQASVREVHFTAQPERLQDSPSAKSIADRHRLWEERVPADDEALWIWLAALDQESRLALLAHCVSYGITAVQERPSPYNSMGVTDATIRIRLQQADRLARETRLDLVASGWQPTVSNYLGRVTKARILQAVREGAGDQAAQRIAGLKKADMASEAERLLAGTGWLPPQLRTPDAASDEAAATADDVDDPSGDDETDEADLEEPCRIAAE